MLVSHKVILKVKGKWRLSSYTWGGYHVSPSAPRDLQKPTEHETREPRDVLSTTRLTPG